MNINSFRSQFDACMQEIHSAAKNNDQGDLSRAAQKASSLISQLQGKEAAQYRGEAVVKLSSVMRTLEASKDTQVQDFAKLVKAGHPQAHAVGGLIRQMEELKLQGQAAIEEEDPELREQHMHQISESHAAEKSVTVVKGKVQEITRPNLEPYNAKVKEFARAKNAVALSKALLPQGSIDAATVEKLHVYTEKGPQTGKKMEDAVLKEVDNLQKALQLDKVGAKVKIPQDRSAWLLALALTNVAEHKNLADILPRIPSSDKANRSLQQSLDKEREVFLKSLNKLLDSEDGSFVESFCHNTAKELGNDKGRMSGYKMVVEEELEKNIPRAKAILDFYSKWHHTI